MHVHVTPAQFGSDRGIVIAESPAELEALLNLELATLAERGATLWDADVSNVGGGRMLMGSLAEQIAGATPADTNPDLVKAFVFWGENEAELLSQRAQRYATDPDIAGKKLYLDKYAGGSNGRLWVNLQIIGDFTPAPPG